MDITQLKSQLAALSKLLRWAHFFLGWALLQRLADLIDTVTSDAKYEPILNLLVYLETQGSYLELLQYLTALLTHQRPAATLAELKARSGH